MSTPVRYRLDELTFTLDDDAASPIPAPAHLNGNATNLQLRRSPDNFPPRPAPPTHNLAGSATPSERLWSLMWWTILKWTGPDRCWFLGIAPIARSLTWRDPTAAPEPSVWEQPPLHRQVTMLAVSGVERSPP